MMQNRSLAIRAGLLALWLIVSWSPAVTAQGPDARDNAAIFYEALAPHGKWVVYGDYGPVWYPQQVSRDWRPYLDGRWVPTEMGWVFESAEPWGWATYHYGNWMPTLDFGWVWCPGRTWYPSTAVWRTSPNYIGWAPIPPPFYTPPPAFAGGAFLTAWAPLDRLLTHFFWILCPASHFFLGFGQPFIPAYAYYHCGCLAPFTVYRLAFPQTQFLTNYCSLGSVHRGYYAYGPSFAFLSQVTPLKLAEIETFARTFKIADLKNLTPPSTVLERYPHFRELVPEPILQGRPLNVEPATDRRLAEKDLLKPTAAPLPRSVPPLKAEIPKAITVPPSAGAGPEALKGVKGGVLPPQAVNPKLEATVPPAPAPPAPDKPGEVGKGAAPPTPPPAAGAPAVEPGRRRGARMIEVDQEGRPVTRGGEAPPLREPAPGLPAERVKPAPQAQVPQVQPSPERLPVPRGQPRQLQPRQQPVPAERPAAPRQLKPSEPLRPQPGPAPPPRPGTTPRSGVSPLYDGSASRGMGPGGR
jgi:hypothetical protein